VQTDGRWTLAALTTALLVLYFTPWLTLGHGMELSGFKLAFGLPALLQPIDRFGIGDYIAPLLGWAIPLLGLIGVVQSARGKVSVCAITLALIVCGLLGFGLWLSPWQHAPTFATLPLTPAGLFVLASVALTLGLNAVSAMWAHRVEERLGITERRRHNGTVAIDVHAPRWRPLAQLLYIVANAAIVYAALLFWAHYHLFGMADAFMVPLTVSLIVLVSMALFMVVRSALRHPALARIVIGYESLRVIAGGDRGRYQRGHIGGLYVPEQAQANVRNYYDEALDENTLTLPVATQATGTPPAGTLLGVPRTHVMMRLRHRTVALAHHLSPAQAKELVRRITIRLLD